jgi:hypothetical protein
MTIANTLSIALVAAISIAAWTSQAAAAVREGAGRDAAMTRCLAQAKRHYPGKYFDWGEVRDFNYWDCMHDAGYVP